VIKALLHILRVQFTHPRPKPRYRFAGRVGAIYRWEPVNDKRAPHIYCRANEFQRDCLGEQRES
jgi:hypothetical protein